VVIGAKTKISTTTKRGTIATMNTSNIGKPAVVVARVYSMAENSRITTPTAHVSTVMATEAAGMVMVADLSAPRSVGAFAPAAPCPVRFAVGDFSPTGQLVRATGGGGGDGGALGEPAKVLTSST
jgi:hypothetical protein